MTENDKSIGRLEGKMDSMEKQLSAVFRKLESHAKDQTRANTRIEAALHEVAPIARENRRRLDKIEPTVEGHERHKNRLFGWVIGSATAGGGFGYIFQSIMKKMGL